MSFIKRNLNASSINPLKIIEVIRIDIKEFELKTGIFSTKNCMNDAGITVRIPKRHEIKYFNIRLSF